MVHERFEIVILEPLVPFEILELVVTASEFDWEVQVCDTGRIVVLEGPKEIQDVVKFLAKHDLTLDTGLIKRITEYEPDEFEKAYMGYDLNDEL